MFYTVGSLQCLLEWSQLTPSNAPMAAPASWRCKESRADTFSQEWNPESRFKDGSRNHRRHGTQEKCMLNFRVEVI